MPSVPPETVLFVIPALNEEENLPGVIAGLRREIPGARVLVVDDGSADETARVSREAGADVIRLPFNLGIGSAVQTGFCRALELGFEWVVRLDADGQHRPEDVHRFLERLGDRPVDLLIGSRFCSAEGFRTSWFRRVGIRFFNGIIAFLSGFRITDATSGFTAFSRRAMARLSRFFPDDYPEPESIIMLYKWGMTVDEVPVTMKPRKGGTSSITYLRSLYYMVKVTLAVLLDMARYSPSRRRAARGTLPGRSP
ncbi:MAG: glycosyltransferase family 2 protein [Acidobacteria bacterium]|nr:glycosyltransferase family 2 protein [Acidobacteriota bacterium]